MTLFRELFERPSYTTKLKYGMSFLSFEALTSSNQESNFCAERTFLTPFTYHKKHDEERHHPKTENLLYQNQSHRAYHKF